MPPQVPRLFRPFDDRWGITWRVLNLVRRFNVRWLARFARALVVNSTHERPIFIIGMPRSGTTFLYYLLRHSNQLNALHREGHDIWRLFHHPRSTGWSSDHVGEGAIRRGERRVVNAVFSAYSGGQRFVEKSADNCVRAPYLIELFPDATFVVIKRNPCDVINSYINGWRHPEGRFRSYHVPEQLHISGYPHTYRWCSTLIEGWRDLAGSTIPEIALAQWEAYVRSISTARSRTPPAQWHECHFEDLLREPRATASALYSALGIQNEPALDDALSDLIANPVNAMTPPGEDKWLTQNQREVRELLPRIVSLSRTLGYEIDPDTGICSIQRGELPVAPMSSGPANGGIKP